MEKNSRSMILRAAYNRFHEGGVKNTTITDIARDAFVQPSTIAYHFKDRSGLEESLMHCIDDSIMSYAESIADSSELILPVWIYLLWNKVLTDKGFRAMQEEIFFSDVNLERESVICYVVSLLQNLYYTFTGKEMPPRGDNWILISNTLNTFMIKGLFDSINRSDKDRSFMFYAEMDLRMKACIIGITDSGSVDQVIERVKELLSDVDLDALLASIPSFEYYEEDNTIQV